MLQLDGVSEIWVTADYKHLGCRTPFNGLIVRPITLQHTFVLVRTLSATANDLRLFQRNATQVRPRGSMGVD